MIKKIIAILLLLGIFSVTAGAMEWNIANMFTGRQMVPYGAPWFADDQYMYFGTDKDVALRYYAAGNTFSVNGTTMSLAADKLKVGGKIVPQEMVVTAPFSKSEMTAGEINKTVFIADDAWVITSIEEVHSVAEGTATTANITVMKLNGTDVPSAGINMTTSPFNLKSAANTVQTGTLTGSLANITLADGNRIGLWFRTNGSAINAFRAGHVTIHMRRA